MQFTHKGQKFDIDVQKTVGLGWQWFITRSESSDRIADTWGMDGQRSADRAYANARQWVWNNV
jgi:hypothetical protein